MKFYDINIILKVPLIACKFFSLNFELENENKILMYEYIENALFVMKFICVAIAVAGESYWFIEEAISGKSFGELTFVGACTLYGIVALVKGLVLFVNKTKVANYIRQLNELQSKCKDTECDRVIERTTTKSMSFYNTAVKILAFFNVALVSLFIIESIIMMSYIYFKEKRFEMLLPFKIKYPFDMSDPKVWFLVFIQHVFAALYAVHYAYGSDSLFIVFCASMDMHFTIIRHRIACLFSEPVDDIRESLCHIFKYHQHLIEMVLSLNSFYTVTIFFNFVTSCILICLTMFQVSTLEDPFIWVFFLINSLSQVFLLSYCGNMIILSSIRVADGVSESEWYTAPVNIQKDLIFFMFRSQKPCKLTAWKIADVDLVAFTRILSKSWSFFVLLRTLDNPVSEA